MKKILVVLFTLLLLVSACGKSSDIDTTELINTALNTAAKAEGNAFDMKLVYSVVEDDMDMKLDMDGLFRQAGAFDVDTFKKGDFTGLEFELVGKLDMEGMGASMTMAAYLKDGVLYGDLLGSKIKMNLADFADELIESFDEMDDDSEGEPVALTDEDLKDVIITEEDGYYNYKLTKEVLAKLIEAAPEGALDESELELFDTLDAFETSLDVNNDGSLRGVNISAKMTDAGAELDLVFTIKMVDIDKADSIHFPDFSDYADISDLGL